METHSSAGTSDSLAPALLQLRQLREAVASTSVAAKLVDSLEMQLRSIDSVLQEQNTRWVVLHEVSTRLARHLDDESLLKEIVRSSAELLRARGGGLILRDPLSGKLAVRVIYAGGRFMPELAGRRLEANEGLAGRVVASGGPVILEDYASWEGRVTGYESLNLKRVLAVPLYVEQVVAGVLMITDRQAPFTEADGQTLTLFAQQAAAALERTRMREHAAALALSEERARVARELHDGLAQDLASLLLNADLCRDLAATGDSGLADALDGLAEGLQSIIRETRTLIHSYQSSSTTGQGLVEALQLLAARFHAQAGVPATLTCTGNFTLDLPAGFRTALGRVTHEALTNVRKHARASEVRIELDISRSNTLTLSIHDNGCGFEADEVAPGSDGYRFGLESMRGRIEELGGSLRIQVAAGCGTRVTAQLPLARPREGDRE